MFWELGTLIERARIPHDLPPALLLRDTEFTALGEKAGRLLKMRDGPFLRIR